MNVEILLLIIGLICLALGAIGHWWCFARPKYDEYRETIADIAVTLRDEENAHDETKDKLDTALERAEHAEREAATHIGNLELVLGPDRPLDRPRNWRGI